MIRAIFVNILLSLAAMGFGVFSIKLLGIKSSSASVNIYAISFPIGMGIIGWIGFFLGVANLFNWIAFGGVILLGIVCFLVFSTPLLMIPRLGRVKEWGWVLGFCLLLTLFLDALEASAPPVDADSLAYHFVIPKYFLGLGQIQFIPIPVEGAIPLLVHVTYAFALSLGGELGLTLWTFTTQIALLFLVYAVGTRWLPERWALTVTLVVATTPAIIYGGGSGHIETRAALFALVAAVALIDGLRTGHVGYIVISALACGFFAASKYYGVYAVTACLFTLIANRAPLKLIAAFVITAILASSQWYAWNWLHVGMPIFPSLYEFFGNPITEHWNESTHTIFNQFLDGWACFPSNIASAFWYPIATTLFPESCWDSKRTGLGPYFLFLIPGLILIITNFCSAPNNYLRSSVFRLIQPALIFYFLWFLIPTNQMTRHLLPVYPSAVISVTVALFYFSRSAPEQWLRHLLKLSSSLCIASGLIIQLVFSLGHISLLFGGSRDQFLEDNVSYYAVAREINKHLTENDRVINSLRTINYLLDVPFYYLLPYRAGISLAEPIELPEVQVKFCQKGISHIVLQSSGLYKTLLPLLIETDSLNIEAQQIDSRTLKQKKRVHVILGRLKSCDTVRY